MQDYISNGVSTAILHRAIDMCYQITILMQNVRLSFPSLPIYYLQRWFRKDLCEWLVAAGYNSLNK